MFPEEKHDFWEIIYCDKNQVYVKREKEKFILKKGEIVFLKPDEVHSVEGDNQLDANIFIVSFVCKSRTMSYFRDTK